MASLPIEFDAGTRCGYTPASAYTLLGQILVEIDPSGRRFREIAKEELFQPLGMKDTSFRTDRSNTRLIPVSHTKKEAGPTAPMIQRMLNDGFSGEIEIPAGNAYGTVHDAFQSEETMRRRRENGYRSLVQVLVRLPAKNHTSDMLNGAWDKEVETRGWGNFPARFTLLGGYIRSHGHHLTGLGYTAAPSAICGVGGCSTMWMVDPERELTLVFISAGFIDRLPHMKRLQTLSDLVLAACK